MVKVLDWVPFAQTLLQLPQELHVPFTENFIKDKTQYTVFARLLITVIGLVDSAGPVWNLKEDPNVPLLM